MAIPINLFEFVKYSWDSSEELKIISAKTFSDDLERALDNIWVERKRFMPSENLFYESSSKKQRFIDFRKNEIVPRNWIGTIQLRSNDEEYAINLFYYLKYFIRKNTDPPPKKQIAYLLIFYGGFQLAKSRTTPQ
jgi:hypothetical protein